MKIGVMHWAFPPVVGGVESHLVYLYEELARRGHEISLLTAPHPDRDDKSVDWIKITSEDYMSLEHLQRRAPVSGRYEKVYDMMERFILKETPEVIHAHNFHYFIPDHAECLDELAKKYGIPIVLTIHNYWEDNLCKHLMRDVKWDKIVAVSYFMKNPCIFHSMLPQDKVEVHYHGVDLNKYSLAEDREAAKARFGLTGRKVIFHPARACKSKGTLHSIEAVSRLMDKYPDICLIVSGNGDSVDFENERPAFRTCISSMIRDLKVSDNMLFIAASGEEMPLYMQASDVILYPTITPQGEAFGIAPVEGMACGKPVIVTKSGGLVESTQHGINGIVLDVGESLTQDLARHIDHLLSNPGLAEYMGSNGRELALERFDSKKMALKMEDLYNRLVNASIVEKVDRMDTVVKPGAGSKGLGADFAGQSKI
ncbi:glycosyltransferase family 4 protein [Methanocella sp. MCL-LM]|uniref:glycosyltransferase family 4 protein n=1 Tax=Methanocella sp. MCL-LM TaxID=3412035 RepID=UPI003C763216